MKYLADLIAEKQTINNMLLIRLFAASIVIVGHSFPLSPNRCPECQDPALTVGLPIPSHGLGVIVFFILSGFLITASAQKHSVWQFIKARALRIMPALAVCVIFLAFVLGPSISHLKLSEYFSNDRAYSYITNAVSMVRTIQVDLPGVKFYDGRYGEVVNGSLWTIPLEVRLYAIALIIAVIAKILRVQIFIPLAIFIICTILFDLSSVVPNEDDYRLSIYFAIGSVAFIARKYIVMHWAVAVFLCLIWLFTKSTVASSSTFAMAISYAIILFAYSKKIKLPGFLGDYSYGIYLYAFPIQQTVCYLLPSVTPYKLMAISLPAAWLAGAISWYLIEKPALKFKTSLRLKNRHPSISNQAE
jgi:peptidoglycan/LPS O-acetylase OafA/YrhL